MVLTDTHRLRHLMQAYRVTQRDAAKAAGYRSHGYISRLVHGEARVVGDEAANGLARLLHVPIEDLFRPDSRIVGTRNGQQHRSRNVTSDTEEVA